MWRYFLHILFPPLNFDMQTKFSTNFTCYFLSISAILVWWYFAFFFQYSLHQVESPQIKEIAPLKEPPPKFLSYLSPLKREQLHEALAGNVSLMTSLIADWDVDARILESQGLLNVKRLSREKFLKSQMIGRDLQTNTHEELKRIQGKFLKQAVCDDLGHSFNLPFPSQKFLPQTYLAASILLSISPSDDIVAIPHGLRFQQNLYPLAITEKIPFDIDRYNSEEIFQQKPEIAFIANYSHPSILQTLRNQGIRLFTIKSIDTIAQIAETINKIGHIANRPLEAELLNLFMESALFAIDNHLTALSRSFDASPRVMFLNHMTQFSAPTQITITGQLIELLKSQQFNFIHLHPKARNKWMIPLSQEEIVKLNPDCLIVATENKESALLQIQKSQALQSLTAIRNNKLFVIDQAPHAPTQYYVLAYFDLAEALIMATCPFCEMRE